MPIPVQIMLRALQTLKTLLFVGCGEGYGAPLVGTDVVYVDTSRAGEGYENAICLAAALVNKK